jgi:hypothetical protein
MSDKEYRTPEQYDDIIDSMVNGNWSQAAEQCVEHGFYANDLLSHYVASELEQRGEEDVDLLKDLILLAEYAAEKRYKK